jgi:hypothetical protein
VDWEPLELSHAGDVVSTMKAEWKRLELAKSGPPRVRGSLARIPGDSSGWEGSRASRCRAAAQPRWGKQKPRNEALRGSKTCRAGYYFLKRRPKQAIAVMAMPSRDKADAASGAGAAPTPVKA